MDAVMDGFDVKPTMVLTCREDPLDGTVPRGEPVHGNPAMAGFRESTDLARIVHDR